MFHWGCLLFNIAPSYILSEYRVMPLSIPFSNLCFIGAVCCVHKAPSYILSEYRVMPLSIPYPNLCFIGAVCCVHKATSYSALLDHAPFLPHILTYVSSGLSRPPQNRKKHGLNEPCTEMLVVFLLCSSILRWFFRKHVHTVA